MSSSQLTCKKSQKYEHDYMKETIDLLTQMAENDGKNQNKNIHSDNINKNSTKNASKPKNKNSANKENKSETISKAKNERKPSIYSTKNSTALLLKNMIEGNDSEDDRTVDTRIMTMGSSGKNSKNSSNFHTPKKNSSRNSSKKSSKEKYKAENSEKKIKNIEYITRLYEKDKEIKEKKEVLRKKYLENEAMLMRDNPKINEKSKMLLSTTELNKPLFMRVDEIQKRKNDDISRIKHILQTQQKEKNPEPTFIPDTSKTKRKDVKTRTFNKFFMDSEEWRQKTKDKNEKFHLNILTEEMKESTFHPQINKKSLKILSQKKPQTMKKDEPEPEVKNKFDENLTFQPRIDEKSRRLIGKKKHKKRNSFMGQTLTSLNRINENKFNNAMRRMSLDPDITKILTVSFADSKKDFYEAKKKRKRGKSECFVEILNKTERKIKEMEDMYGKQMLALKNLNRVEYDRNLKFLVEIVNNKKYKY